MADGNGDEKSNPKKMPGEEPKKVRKVRSVTDVVNSIPEQVSIEEVIIALMKKSKAENWDLNAVGDLRISMPATCFNGVTKFAEKRDVPWYTPPASNPSPNPNPRKRAHSLESDTGISRDRSLQKQKQEDAKRQKKDLESREEEKKNKAAISKKAEANIKKQLEKNKTQVANKQKGETEALDKIAKLQLKVDAARRDGTDGAKSDVALQKAKGVLHFTRQETVVLQNQIRALEAQVPQTKQQAAKDNAELEKVKADKEKIEEKLADLKKKAKSLITKVPKSMEASLKRYGISLKEINKWRYTSDDEKKVLEIVQDAINVLDEWSTSKILISRKALKILEAMVSVYEQTRLARAEAPTSETSVANIVNGLLPNQNNTTLSETKRCFWLSQLARRVNKKDEHPTPLDDAVETENPTPKSTLLKAELGRSQKERNYNEFISQELGVEKYRELKKQKDSKVLLSRRKFWHLQKTVGSAIDQLIEAFGIGVLCCLPNHITTGKIERWGRLRTNLIGLGLQQKHLFYKIRQLSGFFNGWLAEYLGKPNAQVFLPSKLFEFKKEFAYELSSKEVVLTDDHDDDDTQIFGHTVIEAVQAFPDHHVHQINGDPQLSIDRESIASLQSEQEVDSRAIAGTLAILSRSFTHPDFQVFGPGTIAMTGEINPLSINIESSIRYLLVPIHHVENGSGHWNLGVIDRQTGRVRILDSLSSPTRRAAVFARIVSWLRQSNITRHDGNHEFHASSMDGIQQGNGYDCGIFVIANAHAVMEGKEQATNVDGDELRAEYAQILLSESVSSILALDTSTEPGPDPSISDRDESPKPDPDPSIPALDFPQDGET